MTSKNASRWSRVIALWVMLAGAVVFWGAILLYVSHTAIVLPAPPTHPQSEER